MTVYWSPFFRLTGFIPWGIAALFLLLRKNRANQAWLSVAALLTSSLMVSVLVAVLGNAAPQEELAQILNGTALSLCIAWLLAPYMASRSHLRNFFVLTITLAAVNLITMTCANGFSESAGGIPFLALLMICSYIAVNTSMVFNLASRLSKTGYSSGKFFVRILFLTPLAWLITTIPFPLMESVWTGYLIGITVIAITLLLVQLPFLVISFKNQNLRERLEAWQARTPEKPPAMLQDPGAS